MNLKKRLVNQQDLTALLEHVAGNPLLWEQFLLRLTEQLQCDSSALVITDLVEREKTRFLYSVNITPAYREKYESDLNRLDIFNYFISKNTRQVFCNQSLKQAYVEEVERKAKQTGKLNYRIGLAIPCNHHYSLNLLIQRNLAFSNLEQEQFCIFLQTLLPALEAAIHAEQRQKMHSQLLLFMGDHFDGYLVVDQELKILYKDPVYTSLKNDLQGIETVDNRFSMINLGLQQHLLALMLSPHEATTFNNKSDAYRITVVPIASLENLYHWECYMDAFIIAFTRDHSINPAIERLTNIYELSHCEALCALQFMQTPSIHELATSTYRSKATVRNHMKHIMHKMNVHSQAALMKKLMTLTLLY